MKKFLIYLATIAIWATTLPVITVKADSTVDFSHDCEIISQYYNPSLPNAQAGNAQPNTQRECIGGDHGQFPSQYTGNFQNIPQPSKNTNQEWSIHIHSYYNNSKEECFNSSNIKINCPQSPADQNFDHVKHKVASIRKFELTLQEDFVKNIDLPSLTCDYMNQGIACLGEGSLGENTEGKTIGFTLELKDKNNGTYTLTWTFGPQENHKDWVRPVIFGINPILDHNLEVDYSDPMSRILQLGINFHTNEAENLNWSATTTSRVELIEYQSTMEPKQTPQNNADWSPITPPNGFTQTGDNFYWYPIGTTTTIWTKEPPVEQPNTCENMTPETYTLSDSDKVDMGEDFGIGYQLPKYTVIYAPENVLPEGTQLIYVAHDPDGEFFMVNQPNTNTYMKLEKTVSASNVSSIIADIDKTIIYQGKGPITLAVTGPNVEAGSQKNCQATIQVPGEACEELKVDHQAHIYVDTLSRFNAKALDTNGDQFGEKVTYKTEPGYGFFYIQKPTGVYENTSTTMLETRNVNVQNPHGWAYDKYITEGLNDPDYFDFYQNVSLDVARGNIWDSSLDNPNWNPFNSILHINSAEAAVPNDFGIQIPNYTLDNADILDPTEMLDIDLPDFSRFFETITVDQGTPVYFHAFKAGKDKIHVKALGSNDGDCEKSFDIEPFFCEEIKINRPDPILIGKIAEFSAKSLNPAEKTFDGKITYAVDEGYGKFYHIKPVGYENSDPETYVVEFDNSQAIQSPDGGFCVNSDAPVKDFPGIDLSEIDQPGVDLSLPDGVINNDQILIEGYIEIPEWLRNEIEPRPTPELDSIELRPQGMLNSVVHALPLDSFGEIEAIQPQEIQLPENQGLLPGGLGSLDVIFEGKQTITVNPGVKVYFVGEKEGENVIHITTQCTEVAGCQRDLSIEKEAPTCQEAELTIIDNETDQPVEECLTQGDYTMTINLTDDNEEPLPTNLVKIKWTSTDPNGKFENVAGPTIWDPSMLGEGTFLGLTEVIYKGGGKVTASLYELEGEKYQIDNCKIEIEACIEENACADFKIETVNGDPFPIEIGQDVLLKINASDLNGNPLPEDTKIKWTTDTEGKLSASNTGELVNNISEQTRFYESTKTGKLTAEMADPLSPLFSEACKDEIAVTSPIICQILSVKSYGIELTHIEPGKLYRLTGDATYSVDPENQMVTFKSTQGVFYPSLAIPANQGGVIIQNILEAATVALLNDHLVGKIASTYAQDPTFAENLAALPVQLTDEITVADGKPVYFITFQDAQGEKGLTAQATGRSEVNCFKAFDVKVTNKICENILVSYFPSPFDPTKNTVISVQEGDFGDFKGDFKFTVTNQDGSPQGKLYLPGEEANKKSELTATQEQAKNGVIFEGGKEGGGIQIEAVGDLKGTTCNASLSSAPAKMECVDLTIIKPEGSWEEDDFTDDNEQKFTIEVETNPAGFENQLTYKWTVSKGGEWEDSDLNPLINYLVDITVEDHPLVEVWAEGFEDVCRDHKKLSSDEVNWPDIEKLVYDAKDKEWEDGTINMGGKKSTNQWLNKKDQYVTYIGIYEPGSAKSSELWDDSLDNGKIESDINQGELEFLDMAILVDGQAGKYVIYKTEGFEVGRFGDIEIDGRNEFEDYKYYDLESYEDYAENFACGEEKANEICLNYEEDEFEEIYKDFREGSKIELKKTDKAEKIYVIYQMENNTWITDDHCKQMIEEFGVCGEQFDNEINFQAYEDDNFTKELEDGKDEAKVVIICPFILAREGGDVFFHNSIDTGIDVSACYEIETSEGPGITPDKENPQDVTSTGAGDFVLTNPTHSVCKLQNSGIEGYDEDVLKNFSSSVCEMQIEVAEAWKEKYINEAIKTNLKKISRFETAQGPQTITSMTDAGEVLNNGVYVIEGDLTIEGSSQDSDGPALLISETENTPAAQTYIIKNGNLTINTNIKYDDKNIDVTNPKNIPSVAFIVIDGNIEISNDVTNLDGIYMAIDTEGLEDGEINAQGEEFEFTNTLTVRGSLIGNVIDLFKQRRAIGDPLKDESSITIRYDERILLNTPPGLTELIDVTQLKVAN